MIQRIGFVDNCRMAARTLSRVCAAPVSTTRTPSSPICTIRPRCCEHVNVSLHVEGLDFTLQGLLLRPDGWPRAIGTVARRRSKGTRFQFRHVLRVRCVRSAPYGFKRQSELVGKFLPAASARDLSTPKGMLTNFS